MAIRIHYSNYSDYPAATSVSKFMSVTRFFVAGFGFIATILAFHDSIMIGILAIVVTAILIWLTVFIENKAIKYIFEHTESLSAKKARIGQITEIELRTAKAYHRKAKWFLSLSPLSKEFRDEASNNNMTAKEFREYCKSCISKYERLYSDYCDTHKDKPEF